MAKSPAFSTRGPRPSPRFCVWYSPTVPSEFASGPAPDDLPLPESAFGASASILPPAATVIPVSSRPSHPLFDRVSALIEVLLCSGFPSQIALTYLIALAGYPPQLSFGYVATLLLLDAAALIGFIFWLLYLHGEDPRAVFLGNRRIGREALLGLPLVVIVFGLVFVVMSSLQRIAPWLRNVPENPLEQLLRSRRDAALFAVIAAIGGGLREEIQRAFILHRFERHLGGAWVGLLAFSIVFGAGHVIQGWDAVITTATLGVFWGLVYLSRRSIVAPVVSHAGFNAAEILRYLILQT